MSEVVEPTKLEYIRLIRSYVNGEINEESYGAKFQELLARHTAIEEAKIATWSYRYDREIDTDFCQGKITLEERNRRWKALWGETPNWWDIVYLDLVYLGDRRTQNQEVLMAYRSSSDEYERTYFLTEEQFKEELKKYLTQLELIES